MERWWKDHLMFWSTFQTLSRRLEGAAAYRSWRNKSVLQRILAQEAKKTREDKNQGKRSSWRLTTYFSRKRGRTFWRLGSLSSSFSTAKLLRSWGQVSDPRASFRLLFRWLPSDGRYVHDKKLGTPTSRAQANTRVFPLSESWSSNAK